MHRGLQAACPDGLGAAVDTRSLHRIREIGKVLGLKNYKTDLNYKTDKLHWAQEIPQAEEKKKKEKENQRLGCVFVGGIIHTCPALPPLGSVCLQAQVWGLSEPNYS